MAKIQRLTIAEERHLVDRVLAGDQPAINEFYETYKGLFYSIIRRFRFEGGDAEDLFSQFFMRLMEDDWRRVSQWRGESKLTTYLVSSLQRFLIDHQRKRDPLRGSNEDALESITDEQSQDMESQMDLETQKSLLRKCSKSLSDRDQEIYNRHFTEDQPAAEIAEALGMNRNQYYKAIHDTKQRLLKCLQREYPFLFNEGRING